jgi:hypothetical protein
MTVTTTLDRQSFPGDGSNKNFPFNFKFFDNSQIYVYLIDPFGGVVGKTLNIDYTLSGALSAVGGQVVMSVAPPINYRLLIQRKLPLTQPTSIRNQGAFFPAIHEDVFDRLTMLVQQAIFGVGNSLQQNAAGTYWDFKGLPGGNLADPVNPQDAATKSSVESYVASVIETGQGPINNSENVVYVDANNAITTVQKGIYRQFNSVKNLFGKSGYRDGEQCILLSYHEGLKKGGGAFYWDSARLKSSHNGGTVIDPLRSFPIDWTDKASVEAWFAPSASGIGVWVRAQKENFLVTDFGAFADGTTNDQPAYFACASAAGSGGRVIFPASTTPYRMHWFYGFDNQHVIASGARIDLFKLVGGPTVLAAGGNNSRYTGLYLNCLEANLPNVRCSLENRKNTFWEFCSFVGFRDAAVPNLNNAWGIYCKSDCDNHIFYQCYFHNNSQNDVAILEGSTNIQLIGCYGSNLNINIEPNGDTPAIRGITLRGMTINRLLMQENSLTGNSVNNVLVENCDVVNFFYDGAGVRFVGSRIQNLFGMPDTAGRCYAGALDLGGSIGFGPNLLRDPNMVSVSATDTGSTWQIHIGSIVPASRYAGVTEPNGRGLRFNPTAISGTAVVKSELIPVTQAYTYAVVSLSSATYPASGSDSIGQHVGIRWLGSGGAEISTTIVPTNRGAIGTTTATTLEIGIVKAPTGAVNAQYLAGNTLTAVTTGSVIFHSVGFHLLASMGSGNGMNDPFSSHKLINGPIKGYAVNTVPTSSPTQNYYRDLLPGDEILAITPVAGSYRGGINVVAGSPGTMKGNGLIQA